MVNALKDLTQVEIDYLKERGFQAVYNTPSEIEPFPYFTLRVPQEYIEESEISYHFAIDFITGFLETCHPSTTSNNNLVKIIENIAVGKMNSKSYRIEKGKPIKLFVIDKVWKNVAEILVAKYKSS